ncbi:ABC transporter ATP-binding protein [Meiothermus sp. CFH 77666]|uniref:ABC transporter ATP-binding protein n=1 Tax=Meiothermus sp. CFH 77666 TaxID=2817942 RepID=UPI001AA06124|nr:ABC transporter ATP-binding protein [Meiothermus sp. CFH 77666]MBO1437661.1 ABC transporter ATP-binding protein [Meiothermus sp. CFH 77666]
MNLLRLLRPFLPHILLAAGLAVLPAVAQAWLPGRVVKPLFDQILAGQFDRLGEVLGAGAALLLWLVVSGYVLEAFLGYLSVKMPAVWRERVFEHLLKTHLMALPTSSGGLTGRLIADLKELEGFLFYSLGGLLVQGILLLALLTQLLLHYAQLTLYLLLVLPLMALLLGWLGAWVTHYSRRTQAALERLAGRMAEGFGRLELIRALHLEDFALARFRQSNRQQYRLGRTRSLIGALNLPLGQLATTLLLGLLLFLGVGAVQRGEMTPGDLTAFLTLLALAIAPLQILSRVGTGFAQAEGAAARVVELLNLPQAPPMGKLRPETLEGRLELRHLSFSYPGSTATLQNLNLRLEPGSFTAIVGPSGAGKSTLLRVLLGLYPPSEGQVLLDGRELQSYDSAWLRSRMAWVPQEPLLFAGTVQENLAVLAPGASPETMQKALQTVGLYPEVDLPTLLDDEGGGLSVGQRQRLAIAAALLREAKILLLDEITSALDKQSEGQVVAALEAVRPGRTVIVVAHRLSTVQHADQIVVMENGCIAELGTHAELMALGGVYAGLWRG